MKGREDAVYDTFSRALLAGTLAPGAPLRETALAEVFGISRERVRKILQRLGTNRLIEMIPNRGAFVAAPSLEQARAIYDARRIVEGGIVAHLAHGAGPGALQSLQEHMSREQDALAEADRATSVRLSAQFHMLLAEATGNIFIVQQMQELVSRTSMLVAMYEAPHAAQCACEEHRDIFSSLLRGDGAGAERAMRSHLSLVETRLRPGAAMPSQDAVETLRALWALAGTASPAADAAREVSQ